MKKMNAGKRLLALLLALAMVLSMAACGAPAQTAGQGEPAPVENEDELSREDQELIVELMGDGADPSKLTDEELEKLVEQLVGDTDAAQLVNLSNQTQEKTPELDMENNKDAYDENGAMTKPFDQVYPEVIEKEEVAFSGESILIKLASDALTEGLKKAGIGALEEIVPLEGAAWYEAMLTQGTEAAAALEAVRALPETLLAEYNYEIKTAALDDYKHFDDKTDEEFKKNGHNKDQWHQHYCGIPDGYEEMETEGGSSGVVVAVIDSGVDYDHEDLQDNMWFNAKEIPGNGKDDDGNGYVDDYYGINLVKGSGNADDDNGHGTHVAGIIAGRNNNTGVVGIAYNVKIMPIKAAAHNGTLNQADIAKAVLYAYEMGAEVINMSFGGSASSIAVQDALATAYTRCVLVASAGNNGKPNEETDYMSALPNYPAALSYVIGVMSVDENGVESAFSNWDANAFNGVEYEVCAPGENIMSTLPDNRYGYLTGTSMAAPIVSAFAAILRSEFVDRDKYPTKFIYGQLCATSDYHAECIDPEGHTVGGNSHNLPQIVNLDAALTKLPKPEVNMTDYALYDSKELSAANNGDGVIDAGETIALGLYLRNRWGMSENTLVTVDTLVNGIEDPYIEILNPTVDYGSVGTYSDRDAGKVMTDGLQTGWENPFMIKISKDCPNDYRITLNVTVRCENALDAEDETVYTSIGTIDQAVRSGYILPSVIDQDMVLTPDNLYIIPTSTVITAGTTVRVEPGTHIQFWSNDAADPYASGYIAYLLVNGTFLVEGTKEKPVHIYPSELMDRYAVEIGASATGNVCLKYAEITNFFYCRDCKTDGNTGTMNKINLADHCTFRWNYNDGLACRRISGGTVYDSTAYPHVGTINARACVFYKIAYRDSGDLYIYGKYDRCVFNQCAMIMDYADSYKACVFLGNGVTTPEGYTLTSSLKVKNTKFSEFVNSSYDRHVYYREETGTTYFMQQLYRDATDSIEPEIMALLGGYPAVIEDQAEWDWLRNNAFSGSYNYRMGISYDIEKGEFVWDDGRSVESLLDTSALPKQAGNDEYIVYRMRNERLEINSNSFTNNRYMLFEIPGYILPEEITFNAYAVNLDMDATYQVIPVSAPAQLPLETFVYESSNEKVLTVSDTGVVTPVAPGTADVWVTSFDGAVKNYVTITVTDYVALENFCLPTEIGEVAVGSSLALQPVFAPENTTRQNVTYTSSDESIATARGGVVQGVSTGTVTVTAACEGITHTLQVEVYNKTTSLALAEDAVVMTMDKPAALPEVILSQGAGADIRWTSSDESVLKIVEGQPVLLKEGSISLTATDVRSGLSDYVNVFVSETALPKVVKIQTPFVLTEGGKLYNCNASKANAVVEGVEKFDYSSGNGMILLLQDGTMELHKRSIIIPLDAEGIVGNVVDVVSYLAYADRESSDDYFALTDTGAVYWRQGSEANWTKIAINEPVKLFRNSYYHVVFVAESGNLYYSNFGSSDPSPKLIARDVTDACTDGYRICYISNNLGYTYQTSDGAYYTVGMDYSQYDMVYLTPSGFPNDPHPALAVKDGKLFLLNNKNAGASSIEILTGIDPVAFYGAALDYIGSSAYYYANASVADADGIIYNMRSLENVIPFALGLPEETLKLVDTNLEEENVLTENALKVSFNKSLTAATAKLYENGTAITTTTSFKGNVVTVNSNLGFMDGATYTLVIAKNDIADIAGENAEEDITIHFTYAKNTTDKLVHESQLDTSVKRTMTAEDVLTKLQEALDKRQLNPTFCGNAVLNPLNEKGILEAYLKPIAPGVSAGQYLEIPFGGNYWGTTNTTAIQLQMTDYTDFVSYARIMYAPYLEKAPENTFPFVTSVKLINKAGEEVTVVGNEEITFRVTFNRDMDTSIPLQVRFGSAEPYGDYEIAGAYVDARTWEGKYTLNTLIENGNQYFSIAGGCSATDDLVLQSDVKRFGFEIDTTAAQALIMQGTATDTGIALRWTQDDFDTLMGYNVYRATSEDGLYTRVNKTVIPADTMEFFDETVEPGVVYYYNFTVVKTDLTESEPSGKISIMSKDTMAPNIYHSPVSNAFTGTNLVLSATVTDNLNIAYANLYYRIPGTETWTVVRMNRLNSKYSAIIPMEYITTAGIEYYIEAFDGVSYTYKGSSDVPYVIKIEEAVDINDMGDVNGDGTITNLDALLLLYAINDKYNLTAEEFARADLDGNGKLAAAEALRILQYVSGAVGSVKM